jgi:hypothetical protein
VVVRDFRSEPGSAPVCLLRPASKIVEVSAIL